MYVLPILAFSNPVLSGTRTSFPCFKRMVGTTFTNNCAYLASLSSLDFGMFWRPRIQ